MNIKPDVTQLMKREIYTYLTISLVIILAFLIIQVLVVNLDPEVDNHEFVVYVWSWVIGFIVAVWMIGPWLSYLWIVNLSYVIEDERVVIHKGIITKKSVSIPYAAITDFTLRRSLYERWLNIGTLLIQTAGQGVQTGGNEGKLEGLTEYDKLHGVLRDRVKSFKTTSASGSGSPTGSTDTEVLQLLLEEVQKINHKLT